MEASRHPNHDLLGNVLSFVWILRPVQGLPYGPPSSPNEEFGKGLLVSGRGRLDKGMPEAVPG